MQFSFDILRRVMHDFRHQLIPDDELGPLYDLLIDEPPLVRRAIGELVYDHLIAQKVGSSRSGFGGLLYSTRLFNKVNLIYHCALLIDS